MPGRFALPPHPGAFRRPRPSRTDVYRPEPPGSENGFVDVLASAQTLILIAIAILAVGLLLTITWSNRREARHASKEEPAAQSAERPER
ncbi:hypothetical protein ACGFR8_35390 [Streptomyces brevispora]|uniref:hypothetical protein n=1 Tax=Streptomyces brevispora TaxID=887462 RepID=UPI003722D16E